MNDFPFEKVSFEINRMPNGPAMDGDALGDAACILDRYRKRPHPRTNEIPT
jgi:hypothetical protein